MKNQVFMGTPTSPRFCPCPSTVKAGDLVLVGSEPACALNDYQANSTTGNPSAVGGATFYFSGTFTGTVVASSTHSPYTGAAIKVGDKLYASGSLDATTNVTTGLLISVTTTDTPFGWLDPSGTNITSGTTDTAAAVRLSVG